MANPNKIEIATKFDALIAHYYGTWAKFSKAIVQYYNADMCVDARTIAQWKRVPKKRTRNYTIVSRYLSDVHNVSLDNLLTYKPPAQQTALQPIPSSDSGELFKMEKQFGELLIKVSEAVIRMDNTLAQIDVTTRTFLDYKTSKKNIH